MDSVSNLIGNLLSIEDTAKEDNDRSKLRKAAKRHISIDLENFTSFWKRDATQESNNPIPSNNGLNTNNTPGGSGSAAGSNDTLTSGGEPTSTIMSNTSSYSTYLGTAAAAAASTSSSQFLSDKLMEKVLSIMGSNETMDEHESKILSYRAEASKSRPGLSLAIMQKHSNMLHQRNSGTYILINSIIDFLNWTNPYFTMGILLIITHVILKPYLITIVPIVNVLGNIMIPHYLVIYPPDSTFYHQYFEQNPLPAKVRVNKYKIPKPIPVLSQEFVMNLTDTQNFMEFYIKCWDYMVWLTKDYLYFKDEKVSSAIFISLISLMVSSLYLVPLGVDYLLKHFIIVKLWGIINIWLFVVMNHPLIKGQLLEWFYSEHTRLNFQNYANRIEEKLTQSLVDDQQDQKTMDLYKLFHQDLEETNNNSTQDVEMFGYPTTVEIYELQKLDRRTKIWRLVGFTPNFYTTNTATRRFNSAIISQLEMNNETIDDFYDDYYNNNDDETNNQYSELPFKRLPKKESLSEIKPPKNYTFVPGSKWKLDYETNKWVEENLIKDLVIIDDDEKWAYDAIPAMFDNEDGTNSDVNDYIPRQYYRRRRWIRDIIRESNNNNNKRH
ncbi:uncharacterized protein J8A68_006107 [[Candida] subhashii]|uniref:TECPR1-like DysF domain-containing protein n=1 Tax=[Candida] subhashii TaxID=561895 RepID=A0A8J5Q4G4_9ASCO|nr:uncharacterized protein J8A68_006107 [[Candida] subhashii]KAG7660381.1 hypothetical protein J8A68_006107 [[Candida] subhashii]